MLWQKRPCVLKGTSIVLCCIAVAVVWVRVLCLFWVGALLCQKTSVHEIKHIGLFRCVVLLLSCASGVSCSFCVCCACVLVFNCFSFVSVRVACLLLLGLIVICVVLCL